MNGSTGYRNANTKMQKCDHYYNNVNHSLANTYSYVDKWIKTCNVATFRGSFIAELYLRMYVLGYFDIMNIIAF